MRQPECNRLLLQAQEARDSCMKHYEANYQLWEKAEQAFEQLKACGIPSRGGLGGITMVLVYCYGVTLALVRRNPPELSGIHMNS